MRKENGVVDISVIIPVYNREQTIGRCLDSILNQSYGNWECILVDDGSTDRTGHICEAYVRKDNRLRVYHQENKGVSVSRNKGLEYACGNYITFVDSDDYVHPDYLLKLREAVEGYDMSIAGLVVRRENKKEHFFMSQSKVICWDSCSGEDFVCLDETYLLNGPVCKLYKHDIIQEKGLRFPVEISYGEDTVFNFLYLQFVNSVRIVSDCLYYVIKTAGSLSCSYVEKNSIEVYLTIWETKAGFLKTKGINGTEVQLRLCFLYCCCWWDGLTHVMTKHEEFSLLGRYIYMKDKVTRMDKQLITEARTYPCWRRFIIKYLPIAFLFFELKYLIKQIKK